MDQIQYLYTPLVAKRAGTQRLIEGPISANMVDIDGQLVDPTWLKAALPAWMTFGNIREQHDVRRPVGKAQSLDLDHPVGPSIVAKISDDACWAKIEDGVFSGFSIGIRNARIVQDGRAPKGTIVGGDIFEVSVVDHPAVRKAAFSLVAKAAGGWKDLQSGVTFEDVGQGLEPGTDPSLTKAADDEDAVRNHIISIARERGLRIPPDWKDTTTMPDENEAAQVTKAAEKDDKDEKSETDKNQDDGGEDKDEDGDDDYTCPKCSKDARACECYRSAHKAAADFESEHTNPRPINAGHGPAKRTGTAIHAYTAQHEGPESNGAPWTGSDAVVRLEHAIRMIESKVNRIADALDGPNSAGFNPNDPEGESKPQPAGDPNHGMGRTPSEMQSWREHTPTSAHRMNDFGHDGTHPGPLTKKFVEEADVYKIAADVSRVAIEQFFADNGVVTKGAAQDSAKAALADLIKGIAAEVAYEALDQLEARVAQVEKMPMPSKGFAAAQPSYQPNSPVDNAAARDFLAQRLGGMHDDERTQVAAAYIANDWAGVYRQPAQ